MIDVVKSAIAMVNSTADSDRQDSQEKRLSMYLDCYNDEIEKLLKAQFHRDNYDRLYPMLSVYYNLFKKVVNLKSVLYNDEAVRRWYKRDGQTIDERYNDILSDTNLDLVMPMINKLTNINNTAFCRIIPDVETGKIKYSAVPSENITIEQDPEDPSRISALLHRVTISDSNHKLPQVARFSFADNKRDTYISKYFYWTDEKYIVLDSDLKPIKEVDNPYGFIPYVLFSNFPTLAGSIWNETINTDLYEGTLQVNVFQTYLANAMKLSAYLQPYISGLDADEAKKMTARVSDGLQPLVFSRPETTIGTIDLSGGLSDLRETIHDIISEITDNHGVSFSSRTSSAQKQSGMALSIEKEQLDEMKKEQIPLYRKAEKELAEKTVAIANKDLSANIDVEGTFSINFGGDTQGYTNEELERDKFYLSKNLKSLVDVYMELDPDCTSEDEAINRIRQNKDINDEFTNSFGFDISEDDDAENQDAE